jgi:hypothetical protein
MTLFGDGQKNPFMEKKTYPLYAIRSLTMGYPLVN